MDRCASSLSPTPQSETDQRRQKKKRKRWISESASEKYEKWADGKRDVRIHFFRFSREKENNYSLSLTSFTYSALTEVGEEM